jgi:uncharacterized membrane protein (DUF4010 family)
MHPLMLALVASAGLGAMIGLIRQWDQQGETRGATEYAGVRTFTFWSLLGCVAAFLSDQFSPLLLPVVLAAVGAHFLIGRTKSGQPTAGSTTFAAALLTVLVGALVFWKQHQEAILVSALMVVLLGLKHPIHAWTRRFTETDVRATLQFVAVTGVILPLVPDRAYGPFQGFNPHSTWMMVVLISSVGFTGYVLMRLLDTRAGLILTSLLGGLASSTATTLAFSRRSREDKARSESYALGVVIACTIMLPRVCVIVGMVNRSLAAQLLVPFAGMALPGTLYAVWSSWRHRRTRHKADQPTINNPLSLMTAVKFALIYAVISFLVKAAAHFGHLQESLVPLAFVSGLTDLDAISASVAGNAGSEAVAPELAARALVMAAIANSLFKTGLAMAYGSNVLRWHVLILMMVTIAAGVAGFVWLGGTGKSSLPAASP